MSNYKHSLEYHSSFPNGKVGLKITKPILTQQELALAYSPWVSAPCEEIKKDINNLYKYTAKSNTVAVISNGTAVLGLGNLGAAAAKPVMEGKSVLFKKFADIDSVDIEIDSYDVEEFVKIVQSMKYNWGGINLEDIKAPECFLIEDALKKSLDIPVLHDDQHGTAIVVAAGIINALYLKKKKISNIKIVINGAGAASIACYNLLVYMGALKENIFLCDSLGVIYKGRKEKMNKWKIERSNDTYKRSLKDAMEGCDVFLGLSVGKVVNQEMILSMSEDPIVFALANPDPEILPEDVWEVKKNAIVATGRSDYKNQINNVMGFPYIFRGALDVKASSINDEMKMAAVNALSMLARDSVPLEVSQIYNQNKMFGNDYILPAPFDSRLIVKVSSAVAKAAIETGVAREKNFDLIQYERELKSRLNPEFHYTSQFLDQVKSSPKKKIIFAEGEEEEIIKTAILIKEEDYAIPILVGRKNKILPILNKIGLSHEVISDIKIVNAALSSNIEKYTNYLYLKLQREGYLYRDCARFITSDRNIFASAMLACGDADAMITGSTKNYYHNLDDIKKIVKLNQNQLIGYSILLLKKHQVIISDNVGFENPDGNDLVNIALQIAKISKKLGNKPKLAFVSFSNFGNPGGEDTKKIKFALEKMDQMNLDFEYEGEMRVDVALNENLQKFYPFSRIKGPANILVMPNLSAANIATHLLEELEGGNFLGPFINGFEFPVQILPVGASANQILNFAIFAAIEANMREKIV
ncbi:MAG: NADP-dependent malic enzyme [Rickettsia sp.]|nr:NADP-dependent malic enzyme [Rickettsia sp.]